MSIALPEQNQMDGSRQLTYVIDHRFYRLPDGSIWTDNSYEHSFWSRYVKEFSRVRIVARALDCTEKQKNWRRVDGEYVIFCAVPYYLGPLGYLRRSRAVLVSLRKHLDAPGAIILRTPSQVGIAAAGVLRKLARPFAVDVVGDPAASLSRSCVRHFARPLFRVWYTAGQKRICRQAAAACYVAQHLAQAYPTRPGSPQIVCSDVQLFIDHFRQRSLPRLAVAPRRLLTVATLSQLYKGIDLLLSSLAKCHAAGLDLELRIVGDGKHRMELEQQAKELGIGHQVVFMGHLPSGDQIRGELDRADLFILPSRTEGMPRAVLEAMSRGLPCIATSVGGLPEILAAEDLVPPGDVTALAEKIADMARDRCHRERSSRRNYAMAGHFEYTRLTDKWGAFYRAVRSSQGGALNEAA